MFTSFISSYSIGNAQFFPLIYPAFSALILSFSLYERNDLYSICLLYAPWKRAYCQHFLTQQNKLNSFIVLFFWSELSHHLSHSDGVGYHCSRLAGSCCFDAAVKLECSHNPAPLCEQSGLYCSVIDSSSPQVSTHQCTICLVGPRKNSDVVVISIPMLV